MNKSSNRRQISRCRESRLAASAMGAQSTFGSHDSDEARDYSELTFEHEVSAKQRAQLLAHGEIYCAMCGTASGDIDDLTGARASFHVGLIGQGNDFAKGGTSDLRTLCLTCHEGIRTVTTIKPPAIWLLSQVRRAGQDEQRAVLEWLLKKFRK
jgi:hypothetical protein